MNPIGIIKTAASVIVGIGVSSIVGNAIKMTTAPTVKALKKVTIMIGGVALSGLIADAASTWVEDKIDTLVEVKTTTQNIAEKLLHPDRPEEEPGDTIVEDPSKITDYEAMILLEAAEIHARVEGTKKLMKKSTQEPAETTPAKNPGLAMKKVAEDLSGNTSLKTGIGMAADTIDKLVKDPTKTTNDKHTEKGTAE